jgi:hypothetical protein
VPVVGVDGGSLSRAVLYRFGWISGSSVTADGCVRIGHDGGECAV